jgi:hypothetical protein
VLPIVDVSDTTMAASGTTKKISINNVLGCSGTATLASATITGNLTVDTNTLFVDAANNRVGIGTVSPVDSLHIFGTGNALIEGSAGIYAKTITKVGAKSWQFGYRSGTLQYEIQEDGVERYTIGNGGTPHTWYIGASTAMTLNSTGLGVGVSPAAKFDSLVADAAECARFRAASGWLRIHPYLDATDVCRLQSVNNTNTGLQNLTVEGFNLRFNTNNGNAVIIDSLGNTVSNVNSAVPALGTNNRMVFNLTSNTNLRISVRGSDGVTRTTNLTLAP